MGSIDHTELGYGPATSSINPILPSCEYIPDAEPKLFGDRVYLYGSHDLAGTGSMCEGDYVTWSASVRDLTSWRYEGVIFRREQDPFLAAQLASGTADPLLHNLFAPDVAEVAGRYYLYYGVGLSASGIGVAVADSPAGPFEYLGRVRYPDSEKPAGWIDDHDGIDDGDMAFGGGVAVIERPAGKRMRIHLGNAKRFTYDPSVICDRGRVFLYYGLAACRVVELDPADMRTVILDAATGEFESEVLVPSLMVPGTWPGLIRTRGMGMANGPSIRKIDGRYVLVYYAVGPRATNAMCYATATDPRGPFEYGGILVSLGNVRHNGQKRPTDKVGNTHGGMIEVDGTWYLLYHRQTGRTQGSRQATAVALTRTGDGGFAHAEYTSLGFSKDALPAYRRWPAAMACVLTDARGRRSARRSAPVITPVEGADGFLDDHSGRRIAQAVTNLTTGAVVGVKYLDFGPDADSATAAVTMRGTRAGRVEVHLDEADGPLIADIALTVASSDAPTTSSARTGPVSGRHAVYFVFQGTDVSCQFIEFAFNRSSTD
ncbi:family 43 glycosylhydrolase [Microbacterium deminutum]|uniref:Cellulose binding type IV domain-containing protein n=1 Tax=Microbacterium deminutum TaxID=344164 RepID=A0ABP5CD79_9MICO